MKKKKANTNARSRAKLPIAHHVRASLFSVAPHASTGRRLPRHHTSHGGLLLILALAGAVLAVGISAIQASAETVTYPGQVSITARVNGKPPSVGAVITTPEHRTRTAVSEMHVSGTCPAATLVAIYNGATFAGSTVCDTNGTFTVNVQLGVGINVLQAQDYDADNQPGPTTRQIAVAYALQPSLITKTAVTTANTTLETAPTATTPVNTIDTTIVMPATPQPSTNPCYNDASQQTLPNVTLWMTVTCVTHDVNIGQTMHLPISFGGGNAPYAVSIDWGDSLSTELKSFTTSGNYIIDHIYSSSQLRSLVLHVADADGTSYSVDTVVQVNKGTLGNQTSPIAAVIAVTKSSLLDASIPLYAGLFVLVSGFWIGDVFQRSVHQNAKPKRKTTRRHA